MIRGECKDVSQHIPLIAATRGSIVYTIKQWCVQERSQGGAKGSVSGKFFRMPHPLLIAWTFSGDYIYLQNKLNTKTKHKRLVIIILVFNYPHRLYSALTLRFRLLAYVGENVTRCYVATALSIWCNVKAKVRGCSSTCSPPTPDTPLIKPFPVSVLKVFRFLQYG